MAVTSHGYYERKLPERQETALLWFRLFLLLLMMIALRGMAGQ